MEEPQEPLIHEVVSGDAQGPQSLADQLRAKRTEIADTRETLIPIIGYGDPVVLSTKHKLMDRRDIEAIGRRVNRETKDRGERNMRILVDQIIDSTVGFYYQRVDDQEPLQLQDDSGATVQGWDHLALYLGWEGPTPGNPSVVRTALYFVFGDNEFAIGQYGITLNRWMGNTAFDVDQEFLGEGV